MFSIPPTKLATQYKSKYYSYAQDNTILHDGLHEDKTELVLNNITADIINIKSLGNTALLLALKKGNIAVAEALLKHPSIDVFAKDNRGLTALHWACMLRQDKIIAMLLDKQADPHLKAERWVDSEISEPFEMTPLALYEREIIIQNFSYYYFFDEILEAQAPKEEYPTLRSYGTFFNQEGYSQSGFKDRANLYIPGETAYTDIIFHMADLCNNLKWKSKNTCFRHNSISNVEFANNFKAGMHDFCKFRNAIPINKTLLEKMQHTEKLEQDNKYTTEYKK